jgi:hypothetical protein
MLLVHPLCDDAGSDHGWSASPAAGPDLARGVAPNDFTGEHLPGHVADQAVLLVRHASGKTVIVGGGAAAFAAAAAGATEPPLLPSFVR